MTQLLHSFYQFALSTETESTGESQVLWYRGRKTRSSYPILPTVSVASLVHTPRM
jgi:hypothetical protein